MGGSLGSPDKAKEVAGLQNTQVLAEGYGGGYGGSYRSGRREKRCKIKTCRHSYCNTIGAFTDSCTSLLILGSGSGRRSGSGRGGY